MGCSRSRTPKIDPIVTAHGRRTCDAKVKARNIVSNPLVWHNMACRGTAQLITSAEMTDHQFQIAYNLEKEKRLILGYLKLAIGHFRRQ